MKMKQLMSLKKIRIVLLGTLLSVSALLFVAWDDNEFEMAKNLDIYHTLFRELNLYYVDKTNSGDLVKKSIDEMLKNLDPYTVFIPESKIEDYKFQRTGEYGGIGAMVRRNDNKLIVSSIYNGFAAYKAGLKIGDEYILIDEKDVKGKSIEQVGLLMRGQPGTKVNVKVKRPGVDELVSIDIVREKIKINNVPYHGMLDKHNGYIKLSGFRENASDEIKDALKELKKENQLKGLVLDLRSNPGGLLAESVKIVNIFVPKGEEIVSMKGKVKKWIKTFDAYSMPLDDSIPLVVLINSRSASASEIVSGALQDLDRAVVMGSRSFGKGLVQTTRPLSYNTQLKLTTAKYYIPSGRCIQALDYSNRRSDGSVGKVPDSLITEYRTKNNRKVYDGGGINPDIQTETNDLTPFVRAIMKDNFIFDFATEYVLTNDSIKSPTDFVVDDTILSSFKNYLEQNKFTYENETEVQLNKLIEKAKEDKYFSLAENELTALQKKFHNKLDTDFNMYKNDVAAKICTELVGRYFFDKGKIISSLKNDTDIDKALEILNEDGLKTYKSILAGNK